MDARPDSGQLHTLRRTRSEIAGVRLATLFDSRATGHEIPQSGLDLAVLKSALTEAADMIALAERRQAWIGR
jgi:hypothetical protein